MRFAKWFPRKKKGELEALVYSSSCDWYAASSISFLILLAAMITLGFYFTAEALEVTPAPTLAPTTPFPSAAPTPAPIYITHHKTSAPAPAPSHSPTFRPTQSPSTIPTFRPTSPSNSPTIRPTHIPSNFPTFRPTHSPSNFPTLLPTIIGCNGTCLASCKEHCTVDYLLETYGDECEAICSVDYNSSLCVLCYRRLIQDCKEACHKSCDC